MALMCLIASALELAWLNTGYFCLVFAETLKFYRALNTVGTDFLLMQSIFPKRTRQDLKTKFKKEDRINRFLVEKALRNPLDFDLTELEEDLGKLSCISLQILFRGQCHAT
jgi:hypothetical protein